MTDKKTRWLRVRLLNLKIISEMSTCMRRQVGALLLRNNRIISEGFNGAPCSVDECTTTGFCFSKDFMSGYGLDHCIAVHAEINCLLNAAKNGVSTEGTTLLCTTKPCLNCLKAMVNGGIKEIFYVDDYTIPEYQKFIYDLIVKQSKVLMTQVNYPIP